MVAPLRRTTRSAVQQMLVRRPATRPAELPALPQVSPCGQQIGNLESATWQQSLFSQQIGESPQQLPFLSEQQTPFRALQQYVPLLQHVLPHSSVRLGHSSQRPRAGSAHREPLGQHFEPQRARPPEQQHFEGPPSSVAQASSPYGHDTHFPLLQAWPGKQQFLPHCVARGPNVCLQFGTHRSMSFGSHLNSGTGQH